MKLSALQQYKLEKIARMTLGFLLFMQLQAIILEGFNSIVALNAFIISLIIGTTVALFELYLFPGRLRKLNFPATILTKTMLYVLVVITTILLLVHILPSLYLQSSFFRRHPFITQMGIHEKLTGLDLLKDNLPLFTKLLLINLTGCLIIVFFNQISRMLGKDTLLRLLRGKYHQPTEEERIFMFLDVKSSTAIAEKLGNIQYSNLLRDFFYDLSEPVLESRGEIYQYVGDEVVITWKMKAGIEQFHCIDCFFRIEDIIRRKEKYYVKKYGLLPQFKAGLHGGKVVTTQVGDIKSEIVYHGDVLNTAARIQELCNFYGHKLLLSDTLAGLLTPPHNFNFQSVGKVKLRGKAKSTGLVAGIMQMSQGVIHRHALNRSGT